MSDELQWLILRKYNKFVIKQRGLPTLTSEPGNLLNIQTPRYSGLVGSPVVVREAKDGKLEISHRKEGASPHLIATGTQAQSFKKRFNAHRSAKLAITAANDGQRPELARAAAARVLAISVSQRKRLVKGNRKWEKKAEEEKTPTQAVVTTA